MIKMIITKKFCDIDDFIKELNANQQLIEHGNKNSDEIYEKRVSRFSLIQ